MRLSAPSWLIFLVALILGVLSLITQFHITVPYITEYVGPHIANKQYWLMTGGWVLLILGSMFRGL